MASKSWLFQGLDFETLGESPLGGPGIFEIAFWIKLLKSRSDKSIISFSTGARAPQNIRKSNNMGHDSLTNQLFLFYNGPWGPSFFFFLIIGGPKSELAEWAGCARFVFVLVDLAYTRTSRTSTTVASYIHTQPTILVPEGRPRSKRSLGA